MTFGGAEMTFGGAAGDGPRGPSRGNLGSKGGYDGPAIGVFEGGATVRKFGEEEAGGGGGGGTTLRLI